MNYSEYYLQVEKRLKNEKQLAFVGKADTISKGKPISPYYSVWQVIETCREHPIYWLWVKLTGRIASHTWSGSLAVFFKEEPELVKRCIINDAKERAFVLKLCEGITVDSEMEEEHEGE